jgi:hypothetical protein
MTDNRREDWQMPEPEEMSSDNFRKVREMFRSKVDALISELGE